MLIFESFMGKDKDVGLKLRRGDGHWEVWVNKRDVTMYIIYVSKSLWDIAKKWKELLATAQERWK